MEFNERLEKYMRKHLINQKEMASRLGVHHNMITHYKKGAQPNLIIDETLAILERKDENGKVEMP